MKILDWDRELSFVDRKIWLGWLDGKLGLSFASERQISGGMDSLLREAINKKRFCDIDPPLCNN